jgi:hypothetical protein
MTESKVSVEDELAVEAARQGVADARSRGDRLGEARALYELVVVLNGLKRFVEAQAVRARLEPIGRELGSAAMVTFAQGLALDNWLQESNALFDLTRALHHAGRQKEAKRLRQFILDQAERMQRESALAAERMNRENGERAARDAARAVTAAREHGDLRAEAVALSQLSDALLKAGRPGEAAHAEKDKTQAEARVRLGPARQAVHAAQSFGDGSREAVALLVVGTALGDLGQVAEARFVIDRVEQLVFDVLAATELAVAHPGTSVEWLAGHPTLRGLERRLQAAGRDEAARGVGMRSSQLKADVVVAAVDEAIETARRAVEQARTRGDRVAEARALTMLGHGLSEVGHRELEAAFCYHEASEAARQISDDQAKEQALRALAINVNWRRHGLRDVPDWLEREEVSAHWWLAIGRFHGFEDARAGHNLSAYMSSVPIPNPVELLVGFVALKMLGPFAQAFATKLGESLGESTARAIGRLRLLRHNTTGHAELDVLNGGEEPTTLVLPPDLTDEAREGMIDLDATDPEVAGKTLRWYPHAGKWLSEPPPPDSGKPRPGRMR